MRLVWDSATEMKKTISSEKTSALAALGLLFGLTQSQAGVPAPLPGGGPALPGVPSSNTNATMLPGGVTMPVPGGGVPGGGMPGLPSGVPGGIGTLPPGGTPPAGVSTNTPPPMIPGGTPPGTVPGGTVPGGLPTPPINPNTGLPPGAGGGVNPGPGVGGQPPIGVGGGPGGTTATNPEPQLTTEQEAELLRRALQAYIQEVRMIQRQAVEGNMYQQHNLAVLYTLGIGVPFDLRLANRWFEKAALQGLPESQFNLALAYQTGMGVRKDHVMAYQYYNLAAMQALPGAANWRDELGQFMTVRQIEQAQRKSRGFKAGVDRWLELQGARRADQNRLNAILGTKPPGTGAP